MRDPARIDYVLSEIGKLWKEHPDSRLGRLVLCVAKPNAPCPEIASIEDEVLLGAMTKFIEDDGRDGEVRTRN